MQSIGDVLSYDEAKVCSSKEVWKSSGEADIERDGTDDDYDCDDDNLKNYHDTDTKNSNDENNDDDNDISRRWLERLIWMEMAMSTMRSLLECFSN